MLCGALTLLPPVALEHGTGWARGRSVQAEYALWRARVKARGPWHRWCWRSGDAAKGEASLACCLLFHAAMPSIGPLPRAGQGAERSFRTWYVCHSDSLGKNKKPPPIWRGGRNTDGLSRSHICDGGGRARPFCVRTIVRVKYFFVMPRPMRQGKIPYVDPSILLIRMPLYG